MSNEIRKWLVFLIAWVIWVGALSASVWLIVTTVLHDCRATA